MSASGSSGCWQQDMCAFFFPDPTDRPRRELATRAFVDHETTSERPTAKVLGSLEAHVALCRDIHDHPEAWTAAFARDMPVYRFQHQCLEVAFRAYMRLVRNLVSPGRQPDPAVSEERCEMLKMLGNALDFIAASVPRVFKEYIAAGDKKAIFTHCYTKFYAAYSHLQYITLCDAQREFHPREVAGWIRQALEARGSDWRCPQHETSNCSCVERGLDYAYLATFGTAPTLQAVSTRTDEELLRIIPNISNGFVQAALAQLSDKQFVEEHHVEERFRADSDPDKVCGGCGKKELGTSLFKRCGQCRTENYCSRECQKRQWPVHKLTCQPAPERKRGSNQSDPTPSC